jgi:undecaprenol kinase
MKNRPFRQRLGFAIAGLAVAVRSESSFRLQLFAAMAVLGVLVWQRPAPLWWAVLIITLMAVLAAELLNTAIEHLADQVHPHHHPQIRIVKDCAAAAVLVASLGAVGVGIAFAYEQWLR